MPPLFPPEYPYRPDAPLLSLGPAFSEEIARSVVSAIWHENREQPHETNVRTAAGLTMLEALHPRNQLECMLASQAVAAHCAIMDNFRCASSAGTSAPLAIKYRAGAVSLSRMFSTIVRDLVQMQAKPLPPRPDRGPTAPTPSGNPPPAPEAAQTGVQPAGCNTSAATPAGQPTQDATQPPDTVSKLEDLPELPEDIVTRPDGTPGNLTAYTPKPPPAPPYVPPREALIMAALATRPKPWRMVNTPKTQEPPAAAKVAPVTPVPAPEQSPGPRRGPVDFRERMFSGDALARFASTRLDPDAPVQPMHFDHEDSVVELELISTGGDPAAEAERAAMMAAHPEGKPIVTFRHGTKPAPNGHDEPPPDR